MQTITTSPAYEPPYPMHDGYGGREWYYRFQDIEHGPYETEAEARASMDLMTRGEIAEHRAREMNAELPEETRAIMQLKGMI